MIGSKYNQSNNIYYTPINAIQPILKLIPKDFMIWECCNGQGHISSYLKENGYKVITSDITEGKDCLTYNPDHFDMIITNPPFKLKTKIIQRCIQLNKPFLLLVPVNILESKKRYKLFKEYGISYFQLSERIDYIKPDGKESKSPFWSVWIGRNIPNYKNNQIYFL